MPRVQVPMRPVHRYPRSSTARVAATRKAVAGAGVVVVLSILYWLIFYQNLPNNLGLNGTPSAGADDPGHTLRQITKACMLVMSVYVIATRWSLARSLAKYVNIGAAAFLLLAALSIAWSIEPDATTTGTITVASTLFICFAICLAGWHPRRFQALTLPPLMFILVVSLLVGIMLPDRIMEMGSDLSQKNAWHGITLTKNQFGMIASLGAIICVNRWLSREGRAFWSAAGAGVALLCLALSRSNTSLFAALLSVGFMVLVTRVPVIRQRYTTHVVIGIAATMLLYELMIQRVIPGLNVLVAPITSLTGKDTTFSARTIIWEVIKQHIRAAPYLGTGYGAYWTGAVETSPSYVFMYTMYFYPTEAHNGYLDVINDLGYAGLMCVLALLFYYVRQALQLMPTDRNQAALYLGILFQEMVMNMSESDWFARTSTFAVLALAVFCLSRHVMEVRLQAKSMPSVGR